MPSHASSSTGRASPTTPSGDLQGGRPVWYVGNQNRTTSALDAVAGNCAVPTDLVARGCSLLIGTTGWVLGLRERAESEKSYIREPWPEDRQ